MNSFYSTLYGKFADLQIDASFSARFVYPGVSSQPSLKVGRGISDCVVGIPRIETRDKISYGPFVFQDEEFGQAAAIKLAFASTCLLSGKSVLYWLYRASIKDWLTSKKSPKAEFVLNTILDRLARKWIRQVEGDDFYANVMQTADLLAFTLLPINPKDFGKLAQDVITSYLLDVPIHAPTVVTKMAQNYIAKINALELEPARLIDILRDRISNNGALETERAESRWEQIANVADNLYALIDLIPGRWNSLYLPYSNALTTDSLDSVFTSTMITEEKYNEIRKHAKKEDQAGNDAMWHEIFFELRREENRTQKALSRLSEAALDLNFGNVAWPASDYVKYYNLYNELAPQIRRIIERVRMIKNVLDENMLEESGNIDLQVAIQAIASETIRNDMFTKDENLLKTESWTILVDASLSLGESSRQVKSVSICLAETAREIMGSNPWGMFAFSDDIYCIKDYAEPYGSPARARIGGMVQSGLSLIPDAIRACRSMILQHAQDRNYLILVSDGVPSGYPGIETEFAASVKELARYGVDLAAIGIAGSSIKKTIRKARIVDKPADMVKEFMEIYYGLSS